ncbi:MAG: acyloxyacyl hydrolase, partial [Planctomycetota bacterium]
SLGAEGSWWATIGGLYADDFGDNTDINIHGAISHFVVEDVEVAFELGLWGHLQEEDDAFSVNPNIVFRWHFAHDEEKDWTIYADTGIGVMFASDDVPDEGTSFNFMPRAGMGFTVRLGDSNARWIGGVRWHHISNASQFGTDENPARDSFMVYAGIMFPLN